MLSVYFRLSWPKIVDVWGVLGLPDKSRCILVKYIFTFDINLLVLTIFWFNTNLLFVHFLCVLLSKKLLFCLLLIRLFVLIRHLLPIQTYDFSDLGLWYTRRLILQCLLMSSEVLYKGTYTRPDSWHFREVSPCWLLRLLLSRLFNNYNWRR